MPYLCLQRLQFYNTNIKILKGKILDLTSCKLEIDKKLDYLQILNVRLTKSNIFR